jgi:hypothetical protein
MVPALGGATGTDAARAIYFVRVIRRHQWLNGCRGLMNFNSTPFPHRPAWTEIDLGRLRRNIQLIRRDLPAKVNLRLRRECVHGEAKTARTHSGENQIEEPAFAK